MGSGSEDYYTPDAQLADSLDSFDAILAKLHTTIKDVDDIMLSIGTNLNTLTGTIKTVLETMRSQAMGDATSLHTSGNGTVTTSGKTILNAWAGRSGFTVINTGATEFGVRVGGATNYGMALLVLGGHYLNETYCGAVKVKAVYETAGYAYEEW